MGVIETVFCILFLVSITSMNLVPYVVTEKDQNEIEIVKIKQ